MKVLKVIMASTVMAALAVSVSSCEDNNDNPVEEELSVKELALQKAVSDYVDHTVLPTYADMADAAVELCDLCHTIQDRHSEGALTSDDIKKAGEAWKKSRKSWELSEAFLFGPAANHNIDPHIDSWPLDKAAMDDLLDYIRTGKNWDLSNNGGYGLIGFHSLEYMLFELTPDGNGSLVHSTSYSPEELVYLVAVAEDLRDQCVLLEACWAGTDNIGARKQQILEDAELDYGEEYGWEMKNAGKAGSRFKTYQQAAEEILQGCADIADEVGNTKIGRPHQGTNEEDKNYIESPYSLNSIEDFVDNIRSIENSYCGSRPGDASLSDYIKSVDPDLDVRLRNAVDNAVAAIQAIPEPFAKNATGVVAEKAVKAAGTDLNNVLVEVYQKISRY